jgi:hypothetical protein
MLRNRYYKMVGYQLQHFYRLLLCHSLVRQQPDSAKVGKSLSWQSYSFPLVLVAAFSFASCEKVISLDLDKVQTKYVIEGMISDQHGSCRVMLTQTKNFDENNTFSGISGAEVTISDNNGMPQPLREMTPGVYAAAGLTGVSLHTYLLTVKINGLVFTASSTMPARVPFDSLSITERTFFDETNKYASVRYKDPAGEQNAYRFIQYVNGKKEKTIFVRDDDNNDGNTIDRTLLFFYDDAEAQEKKLKSGDQVTVEMLSISYPVYKYWYSLTESATGENQSATPGNPLTNIRGGALGYFSAHTLQTKTVTVP